MGVKIEDTYGSLKRWESDLAGWEIPRMTREMFYAQVDSLLLEAKAFTHVQTGSLQASGKVHTSYDATRGVLEATIEFGGISSGSVHDPVRYAVYEAARGPAHNPLTPVYAASPGLDALFSDGNAVIRGKLT